MLIKTTCLFCLTVCLWLSCLCCKAQEKKTVGKLKGELQRSAMDSLNNLPGKLGVEDSLVRRAKDALHQGKALINDKDEMPDTIKDQVQHSAIDSIGHFSEKLGIDHSILKAIKHIMNPSNNGMDLKKSSLKDSLFTRIQELLPEQKAFVDSATQDLRKGYTTLQQDEWQSQEDLPLLSGGVIQDSLINEGHKIQKQYLADKIKLRENKITDSLQTLNIQEISTFKARSYFEGIISLPDVQSLNYMSLVPSFGYGLTKRFSMGAGVDYTFATDNFKKATLGLRSFAKWSAWPDKLYLQLENTSLLKRFTEDTREKGQDILSSQMPALGIGGLFPVSDDKSINLALFRKLITQPDFQGLNMPWMARIGMSFF